MENSFQTSFIPKKPIIDNPSSYKSSNTTSISMVVSVFMLVVVALAAGGLFFYKDYLQKNKEELSSNLLKIKERFNDDTIVELEMYDKKSAVARQVLENHIVLSPLFEAINELTLSSIQYNKFDHATINDVFTVKMSGVARDYKSIALQADVFSSNKLNMFKNLVFSNLTKDKNNYVTFNVEFTVDPSLLAYSNNLKSIELHVNKGLSSTDTKTSDSIVDNPSTDNTNQLLQATDNIQ